jgi:hypothetical protein
MGSSRIFYFLINFLFSVTAIAQTPDYLPIQGRLTDASGNVINYAVTVNFRIYPPSGLCHIYEETQSLTPNDVGLFSTLLGNVAFKTFPAGPLPINSVFNNASTNILTDSCLGIYTPSASDWRRLEIVVNGFVIPGMQTIASSPYAIQASFLGGKSASEFIQVVGNVTQANMATLTGGGDASSLHIHAIDSAQIIDNSITDADLNSAAAIARSKLASGTANHVLINNGSGVMSSEAQLNVTRGGTGLSALGAANQLLGVNNAGTATEYKTVTAGSGVTLSNTAGNITINATGTGGTVTSVNVAVPAYMSTTGGPVTGSGSITLNFVSQAARNVFAAPAGAAGAPSFRLLNILDIQSSLAGAFLTGASCGAGQALTYSSITDTMSCNTVVPSISSASALPSAQIWVGDGTNIAQPRTLSGDATLSNTGVLTLANTAVTAGSYGGANGVPTFTVNTKGLLTAAAATSLDITNGTTGTLGVSRGGTGISSGTSGGIPYFSGATTIASSGALTLNGIMLGGGAGGAPTSTAAMTNGQILMGSTGVAPVVGTITGTANQVTVTNGAGTITLSAPQNIHTGASPVFTGLRLSGLTNNALVRSNASGDISNATSVDLTTALGFTPVNRAGDSMTGSLSTTGQMRSVQNTVASGAVVNLNTGNTQVLSAPGAAAITLNNMQDGAAYTIVITDSTSRTYSFTNCTSSRWAPAPAPTTGHSVFSILKVDVGGTATCYISWITGF